MVSIKWKPGKRGLQWLKQANCIVRLNMRFLLVNRKLEHLIGFIMSSGLMKASLNQLLQIEHNQQV